MTVLALDPVELRAPAIPSRPTVFRSTGRLEPDSMEAWSQPSIVFYTLVSEGQFFRGELMGCLLGSGPSDEYGFNFGEMQAGEAEIRAGQGMPHIAAMNALRARIRAQSS